MQLCARPLRPTILLRGKNTTTLALTLLICSLLEALTRAISRAQQNLTTLPPLAGLPDFSKTHIAFSYLKRPVILEASKSQ